MTENRSQAGLLELLDPEVKAHYSERPVVVDLLDGWEERRASRVLPVPAEGVLHSDLVVANDVPVRIYRDRARTGVLPAVLFIHSGAFVYGSAREFDPLAERIACEVGAVVVSVDYRLAPEHPFPAAFDDCYSALCWLCSTDGILDVDANRVAVVGQSAGGALAAAVALAARDRGGPPLALQALIAACLDDRQITTSSQMIDEPRVLNRELVRQMWSAYLPMGAPVSAYGAPAHATDLSGLPAAYVAVGELDPLRDENVEYATRLQRFGVPVELRVYPRVPHGFEQIPDATVSAAARADLDQALYRSLCPAPQGE